MINFNKLIKVFPYRYIMSNELFQAGIPYTIEKSKNMEPYWDALKSGKFQTTECTKCDEIHYPPSPIMCPKCYNTVMNWTEIPLEGSIITYTFVTSPPEGFFTHYSLVSVMMDKLEKPILGRFIGDKIDIGNRVKIEFHTIDDTILMVFTNIN